MVLDFHVRLRSKELLSVTYPFQEIDLNQIDLCYWRLRRVLCEKPHTVKESERDPVGIAINPFIPSYAELLRLSKIARKTRRPSLLQQNSAPKLFPLEFTQLVVVFIR
jgi:hypothetical protein